MKSQSSNRGPRESAADRKTEQAGDASPARDRSKTDVGQVVEAAKQRGQQALHAVKDEAQQLAGEAGEATQHAVSRAKTKAQGVFEERKVKAASRAQTLQRALRQASTTLRDENETQVAEYADLAASRLAKVHNYLDQRSIGDLAKDAEAFTRRHPEIVFGGLLVAGLATARFLKSTARREPDLASVAPSSRYAADPSSLPAAYRS